MKVTSKIKIAIFLAIALGLSLCGCSTVINNLRGHLASDTKAETTVKPDEAENEDVIPRYSVVFDEDETFPDESSRLAAERIDPVIRQAVDILCTSPAKDIVVFDCDYSQRPTEKDGLTGNEEALAWYDFIYEKMSSLESFRLDPADYGGEEELYFPFYTAEVALYVDHREIFMCGTTWAGDDGVIYPIYFMPGEWVDNVCDDMEAIRNAAAVYYRVVDRIFEKMPQNLSNYEKVWYFVLVISVATDYQANRCDTVFSPYDTLVTGHTVCNGYARTFLELCKKAGISAWYLTGMAPGGGYHGWNRIDTANGPLYIDLTWYDSNDITDQYWQGDEEYLFMTQEDFDAFGYVEGASPEEAEPF